MTRRTNRTLADIYAASSVIAWRTAMMGIAAAQPTPARTKEMLRMVHEKNEAAFAGMLAAQRAMVNPALWWPSASNATKLWDHATAPGLKTMRANAKRLRNKTM